MSPGIELTLAQQHELVVALQASLAADRGQPTELIETHISYVLVGPETAYKFKKVIRTGFLDQSCLTARLQACREELRLNRRLAPALYLDVLPVTREESTPRLGGEGLIVDFVVVMRAFAQEGLWDRLARRADLHAAQVDDLLAQLLAFHADAARAPAEGHLGSPAQIHALALANVDELEALAAHDDDHTRLQHLRAWEADTFARLEPVMAHRLAQGHVRECHGDLHLGNVAQIDGRATVFDAIDFNAEYRYIDVMSEIAFLAMDLQAHGLAALARRFVGAYLEASGDYEGVQVLDYYLVHRALVRAKVAWLRAAQQRADKNKPRRTGAAAATRATGLAEHYLALAEQLARGRRPMLLFTHGYSGSGKSTLTQGLVEATGAIRIRSDVERKRMAAAARSSEARDLYAGDMTAATYERLRQLARTVLQAGRSVVLDATFLQQAERSAVRQLALELGLPCVLLEFDLPVATLRERLRLRKRQARDVSDADEAVLERQLQLAEPLTAAELDTAYAVPQSSDAANPSGGVDWAPLLGRYPQLA